MDKSKRKMTINKYKPSLLTLIWLVWSGIVFNPLISPAYAANPDTMEFTVILNDSFPPYPITNLIAQPGITEGSVSLSWTAPIEDNIQYPSYNAVSRYDLRYATYSIAALSNNTTQWWQQTLGNSNTISGALSPGQQETFNLTLAAGVTYYFSILSYDDKNNVSLIDLSSSAGMQAETIGQVIPPNVVTDLTAKTGDSEGTIVLSWSSPGDDGVTGLLNGKYLIDYTTDNSSWPIVNRIEISTTNVISGSKQSVMFTGLGLGVTYYYRLWTVDDIQSVSESNVSQTYAQVDVLPPAEITDLTAVTGSKDGEVVLSWTSPVEDNGINGEKVKSYVIKYNQFHYTYVGDADSWWKMKVSTQIVITTISSPGTKENYTLTNLIPNTTYYFGIKSVDDWGNYSGIDTILSQGGHVNVISQSDITAPEPVNNLVVVNNWTTLNNRQELVATLTWTKSASVDSNYAMIRVSTVTYPVNSSDGELLVISSSTVCNQIGLSSGVTYYYTGYAIDTANNYSSGVSAYTTGLYDAVAPSGVIDLSTVSGVKDGELKLTWTSPGDDGTSGILQNAKFKIQYSTAVSVQWLVDSAQVTISTSTLMPYTLCSTVVTGLVAGTTYYCVIWTTDDNNNVSIQSNLAYGIAQDLIPSTPKNLRVVLLPGKKAYISWTMNTEPDILNYQIYRGTESINGKKLLTTIDNTRSSYIDTNLNYGTTYYYQIIAIDNNQNASVPTSTVKVYIQEPVAGECLFDNFDNALTSAIFWQVYEGTWVIENDVYNQSNATTSALNVINNKNYTNFTLITKLNVVEGTAAGVVFRMLDNQSGYKYGITSSSGILSLTLSTLNGTILGSSSSYEIQPSSWYWLKISCIKENKKCYVSSDGINYTLVMTENSNTDYNTGYVGLYTNNTTAVFDDTRIILNPTKLNIRGEDKTLVLNWEVDNTKGVGAYNIYRGTTSEYLINICRVTNITVMDTGLTNGVTYYYRVTVVDNEGYESEFSEIINSYPYKPEIIYPDAVSGKVTQSDGTPLTGIVVEASVNGAVEKTVGTYTDGTYSISGLVPGTTYMIKATYWVNDSASSVYREIITGSKNVDFTIEIKYQLGTITGFLSGYKINYQMFANAKAALKYATVNYQLAEVRDSLLVPGKGVGFVELYNGNKLVTRVPVDETDGKFEIPNLLPGKYYIKAYNGIAYNEPQQVKIVEGANCVLTLLFPIDIDTNKVYCYPNPTKTGAVNIVYECSNVNHKTELKIYNIEGELVISMTNSFVKTLNNTNKYEYQWICKNDNNQPVASGVYIAVLTITNLNDSNDKTTVRKKIAILK